FQLVNAEAHAQLLTEARILMVLRDTIVFLEGLFSLDRLAKEEVKHGLPNDQLADEISLALAAGAQVANASAHQVQSLFALPFKVEARQFFEEKIPCRKLQLRELDLKMQQQQRAVRLLFLTRSERIATVLAQRLQRIQPCPGATQLAEEERGEWP